jgi:GT2 family glycosyltransferase
VTRLSAIVPATDTPPALARCVEAIRNAEEAPEELIVVESAAGPGPAAARNAGAEQAKGDVLVFVDSDVLAHSDTFRRIRAAFDADPELAAVFGSYDDSPEAAGAVSGFRNLLHHFVHQSSGGPATTFWAGLGAVRRDVFTQAGGFDSQRYREPSIEDIELGMRLAAVGARMKLDPGLQGTHLKHWTVAKMIRTDLHGRGVPWVALLARESAAPTGLNLGWRHRLSAAASIVLVSSLATRRPRQAGLALGALIALNAPFYALLLRRRGPAEAALGVGLHALHHLTAACAVPLGLLAHARERRS